MQTLPLAIWGLRPAEGTSEQPLQAEAGFAGVLEQALPTDGTDAVSILGEERLEAGSNGPTALDQELDQAEASEEASDLMSLVMSFVQPGPSPSQPTSAPIEFAAVVFPAEKTAVKTEGKLPAASPSSQVTSASAAFNLSQAGEALPITESSATQASVSTALPEAPASPEPASLFSEAAPSLLSKKTVKKQEASPRTQTALQEPTGAQTPSKADAEEAESESTSSPEPGISLESERPVEVRSSKKQAVQADQKSITVEETQTPVQSEGLGSTEAKPYAVPVSVSASTKVEEAAPRQANVVAETSSLVAGPQQPRLQAEHSVQDSATALEVKGAAQPLRKDAPTRAEAASAEKDTAEGHNVEAAAKPLSAQSSESRSSAVRSRVNVPSFAHQSDPVSQMLTERWVAWVKQIFSGPDAPKTPLPQAAMLPASPNQAFNVTIQDGQVHMELPKPVTEVFLSPAAVTVIKTTGAILAAPTEEQVQEDASPNQIAASTPSSHHQFQAAAAKVLRQPVVQQEAEAEESLYPESSDAPEAPLLSPQEKSAANEASAKPPMDRESQSGERLQPSASNLTAGQVKPEPAVVKAVVTLNEATHKQTESSIPEPREAATEPIAVKSSESSAEPASPVQTPHSVQVKTADRPLTSEKAEAAVSQAREALASQVQHPRGQQTTIRLNPDDLGSLTITVRQRGRKVEADISASLETVRQVLESQKQELVQAVESKGSQLSHLTIKSEASAESSQNGQMNQQGQQRDGQAQREAHQEAARFSRLTASHETISHPVSVSTQPSRARQSARFDLTA